MQDTLSELRRLKDPPPPSQTLSVGRGPILVDVDSVLTDWTRHLCEALEKRFGRRIDPADVTHRKFFFTNGLALKVDACEILQDPAWWETLPPDSAAQKTIPLLRRYREVLFVTAPWHGCSTWGSVRRAWLKKHFKADRDQVLIGAAKKHINGSILIEDHPRTLVDWKKAQGRKFTDCYFVHDHHNRSNTEGLSATEWTYLDERRYVGWVEIREDLTKRLRG